MESINSVNSLKFGNIVITLRKFKKQKTNDDSLCFTANIYLNNEIIGNVINNPNNICFLKDKETILKNEQIEFNSFCDVINTIANNMQNFYEERNIVYKKQKKGLVFRRKDNSLFLIPIKNIITNKQVEIENLLSHKKGINTIKSIKRKYEMQGCVLLNTNLF